MTKKASLVMLACLFGCNGLQSGSTKAVPWTTVGSRGGNTLPVPLLYKKSATIGFDWIDLNNVAVNASGDVFASTFRLVKEVRPPFTGRTHGRIKVLVKCCKYYPVAVGADDKGEEFFLDFCCGAHPHGGLYLIRKHGGLDLLCRGPHCGTDSSFAVDANGNVFTFSYVETCSGPGTTCTNVYEIVKQGDTWLKPAQYGPQLPFQVSSIAVDAAKNLYMSASCYQCPGHPIYMMDASYKVSRVGKWFTNSPEIAVERGCKVSCDVYVSLGNKMLTISPPFRGETNGTLKTIYYGNIGNIAVQRGNIYAIVNEPAPLIELSPP
jgi:hypothetical protein